MRTQYLLLLAICATFLVINGCAGLFVWNIGKYYYTELDTAQSLDNVYSVGIYVFGDGPSLNTRSTPGLDPSMWPRRATRGSWIFPDTSNTGPSLELAIQVREQLNQRGYSGIVMEDLGHSKEIKVEECLANAREHQLDAAIVVFYTGLHTWREPNSCKECWEFRSMWRTRVNPFFTLHRGFLYLPNAAIFNPVDESTIWSTNYYGIVQGAHIPNLSNEEFSSVANLAVLPSADTDYFSAAPKTARLMFDPLFWPGSFKEFPRHPRRDRTL